MENKTKLKKWVLIISVLFICYHIISFIVTFALGISNISFWLDNVKYTFGRNIRTYVAEIPDKHPRLILRDISPEDQIELKKKQLTGIRAKVLDHNIYAYEGEDGFFFTYKDDVFYSYGSTGFFVIYADPFLIKLVRSENLPEKWRKTVAEDLSRYSANEFKILTSTEQLTKEEKAAYERLQLKAQKRIAELKKANEYP